MANYKTLRILYLLQFEALTVFRSPGESEHLGHMMAPLCQELVQSAYISVANGQAQYVCWLQPVGADKDNSERTLHTDHCYNSWLIINYET